MKQKYLFLESEGDRWFERNRDDMVRASEADPVTVAIGHLGLKPKRVLEIGCSNGWRLACLRDALGCEVMGIEPSMQAAIDAASRRVPVVQATASSLPISDQFDLVIYGFCLYLTDPSDWLRVAAEGDAVLAPGGHLIVHDFYGYSNATARRYEHRDGVLSYHFDFAGLWLAHPLYTLVGRTVIDDQMLTVMKKLDVKSIPVLP
jgi:SAM-dependent methyltransferase